LVSRTHQKYLIFVTEQLQKEYGTPAGLTLLQQFYSDLMFWITPVDLSATVSLMRSSYSPKTKGRKPRDPADMLRSLLIMTKLGMSVDDWVRALRTTPVYAILSGFAADDTPGVGTFYDFFRRLWKASTPHKTGRLKRRLKKPRKKGKKNEKQEPKNPKITEKLVSRALREGKIRYSPKEHDLLQHLFQTLFVLPSAAKGLLGVPVPFASSATAPQWRQEPVPSESSFVTAVRPATGSAAANANSPIPMPTGAGTVTVKDISTAERCICSARRIVRTICRSILDCSVPTNMTRCLGFAGTANFVTGTRNGSWEKRFWIPPTTLFPSIPCWNMMMFPPSST